MGPQTVIQQEGNMSKRRTTEEFIKSSKSRHGSKYDYSKSEYINALTKVTVICKKHGPWKTQPRGKYGHDSCPKCKGENHRLKLTQREFLTQAKAANPDRPYDYSNAVYEKATSKVDITCKEHGPFAVSAYSLLRGVKGCKYCHFKSTTSTTDDFVAKAKTKHTVEYDYSKTVYVRSTLPVTITCPKHGDFTQTPNAHLSGRGCRGCTVCNRFSKIAVKWVEEEAKRRRFKNVQHAMNGGEFWIPGANCRVDGYHARSRTVFEFHGDAYHGNPERFSPRSRPHPFNNMTAKQLYKGTMKREQKLRDLGYNVISIWEKDYRDQLQKGK